MGSSLRPYTSRIWGALQPALCLQTFPCQHVERHNKPEIEIGDNPELLLPPVTVSRSEREYCFIEPSINSVRVSLKFNPNDRLEEELLRMHLKFMMQRAEALGILRRIPLPSYDVSFLITDQHCRDLGRVLLADFVCSFVEYVDAEVNEMKLCINARGRAVATEFLRGLAF